MINTTQSELVFNVSGKELDSKVRSALDAAASALTNLYGAHQLDLLKVSTKSHVRLAYVKYVRLCTLASQEQPFDEAYVLEAYKATRPQSALTETSFYKLTLADPNGPNKYRPSYRATIQLGQSFFLLALHSSGAITLPYAFNWPRPKRKDKTRIEIGSLIGSELIKLVRSVSDDEPQFADAFKSVTTHERRRTWFLSNGTKTLLALGWNRPEDVSLAEPLKFKEANDATNFSRCGPTMGYRALVDVLERRYGSSVAISVRAWDDALGSTQRQEDKTSRQLSGYSSAGQVEVFSMLPSDALPERISRVNALPGLSCDFVSLRASWVELQKTYLKKLRLENTKEHARAIGNLNLYLFFYLPYWFDSNKDTPLRFPSKPSELLTGIFISRLTSQNFPTPLTYLEFLDKYGQSRGWAPTSKYITLRSLEQFFEFLQKNSKELPGCVGFVQPLAKHDFPSVTRSGGTNKRPIPRRLFAFYVAYVEALVSYTHVVLNKILSGEIPEDDLTFCNWRVSVIDTVRVANLVGYIPMVFFRGKAHRLQFIPNCMDLRTFTLKDGRDLRIPQPHGLHHVLVAIYTGLRNQHIQWLDVRTYDSKVGPDDTDLTKLLVNTDKVKNKSWDPHVNMRVIQILREQHRWRDLIACSGFNQTIYYERNPKTKWPKIQPLFAVEDDGYPHPDNRYSSIWSSILMGVQGMVPEIDCGRVSTLVELLPSDVPYGSSDKQALLSKYSDSAERVIELLPKSDITPHSARVGVVSNLITVLPAELIGKYVTGQHESVVYHYVYVDEDDMRAAQEQQSVSLQMRAFGKELTGFVANPDKPNPRFIKADSVNSNFSRAMRQDLTETLASYGCVTLSLREDGKNGIDVLRKTRGANAAFNKTEVCPFGNHCPPDVLRDLRGIGRCGMCPYAVRSIDHLPPVVAKVKQLAEQIDALESSLDAEDIDERYSELEQQQLEAERQRIGDELVAWKLASEVLEAQRRVVESGHDSRRWVVAKPEIIEQALKRIAVPTGETAYVLARLAESVAYPTFDSPEIRARFDLLRRQLLANTGNVRAALTSPQPPDVASQCAGLLRTVVDANGLNYAHLLSLLTTEKHLEGLPEAQSLMLLGAE